MLTIEKGTRKKKNREETHDKQAWSRSEKTPCSSSILAQARRKNLVQKKGEQMESQGAEKITTGKGETLWHLLASYACPGQRQKGNAMEISLSYAPCREMAKKGESKRRGKLKAQVPAKQRAFINPGTRRKGTKKVGGRLGIGGDRFYVVQIHGKTSKGTRTTHQAVKNQNQSWKDHFRVRANRQNSVE